MKTTIVCGVLGAGKTTFLRNILRKGFSKTVVLVNDFGSAGIDGDILSTDGIDTIELPSGCICCTLRFDLINTITKIIEQFNPEHLFIEPSGIASPSGVIEVLDSLNIQPITVVGIVDATEFIDAYETEMYGWFFKSQVTRSDIVLINKTDLVDEEKAEQTVRLVETLNHNALIIPTVNAELSIDLAWKERDSGRDVDGHEHAFPVENVTVLLDGEISFESFRVFFAKMASGQYGNVIRAKALIQTDRGPYRFDLASKQVAFEPFAREIENSRLVVLGSDLKEEEIRELHYSE